MGLKGGRMQGIGCGIIAPQVLLNQLTCRNLVTLNHEKKLYELRIIN